MVTVPLSWTYTNLVFILYGDCLLFGSILIVILEFASSLLIFMRNPAQVFSSVLLIKIPKRSYVSSSFLSQFFVPSLPHDFTGKNKFHWNNYWAWWSHRSHVVYSWMRRLPRWGSLPWVLDLEFSLFNFPKFHDAFLSAHTPLCITFVNYVLLKTFISKSIVSGYIFRFLFN